MQPVPFKRQWQRLKPPPYDRFGLAGPTGEQQDAGQLVLSGRETGVLPKGRLRRDLIFQPQQVPPDGIAGKGLLRLLTPGGFWQLQTRPVVLVALLHPAGTINAKRDREPGLYIVCIEGSCPPIGCLGHPIGTLTKQRITKRHPLRLTAGFGRGSKAAEFFL